jgi:hypothetical protein
MLTPPWNCGAGSLLPTDATRSGLPQDFSMSISLNHTTDMNYINHNLPIYREIPLLHIMLTGPMSVDRKAAEQVTHVCCDDRPIKQGASITLTATPNIPTHLDSNECVHCCCGELGVWSDGVPITATMNTFSTVRSRPNNVSPEDGSCGACYCFSFECTFCCSDAHWPFRFPLWHSATTQLIP